MGELSLHIITRLPRTLYVGDRPPVPALFIQKLPQSLPLIPGYQFTVKVYFSSAGAQNVSTFVDMYPSIDCIIDNL